MNTLQNRMSKYLTFVRFRKAARGSMVALCLLGAAFFSQGARAQLTTSNLDLHFELIKATSSGTVEFTISPEDPNQVARAHWPIIFIDWMNDGNNVTQMFNLKADRTFTVNINNTGAVARVYGENGTWKLVCKNQSIKATKLEEASALRYLDLSKNVLGTNNPTTKDYTVNDKNNKLETLILDENQLKDIKFGTGSGLNGVLPELKEYSASENLLSTVTLTGNNKLSYLDLSKNLLTSITLPTAFVPTWTVFKGGSQTDYDAALAATPSPITNTASTQIHTNRTTANDGMLNLTVNKLDIAKLPTLPTNLNVSKYYYTLQERYSLPKNEYKMLEEIDLSSQLTATGVQTAPQTTTYRWFREIAPNTDNYIEMVRGSDYEETGGKTKFYRAYGDDTKIFAAMTTDAFDGTTGTYPLESFERGTGAINLHGFEEVLIQPAGTTAAALKNTYFASVKTAALNQIGDGLQPKTKATQFFRTNTLTVKGSENNFWYGFKSNDWNDVENWTGRVVPNTETATYNDDKKSDVFFASTRGYMIGTELLSYPTSAIRDLYTDKDRVVRNLYNKSEDGRAIVADAGHTLTLKEKSYFDVATKAPYSTATDLSYRTIVKSVDGKPNGTFLVAKPTDNPNYVATVEFYSKANDGNRNKQAARWQYFGSPVKTASVAAVVPATSWVRKYNRALDIANTDEKWEEVTTPTFTPGHGYEITQPRPMTYRFTGELDLADHNFPVDGVTGGPNVNYKDMNILANPYTATMKIADIDWTGAAAAEQTVYLYNTGSREEWLTQNGGKVVGDNPGQYAPNAIPTGIAGHVANLPTEIPSLSAFMIKSTGTGTVKYSYASLLKNTAQNRAPRRRFSSLMIDVESDKSADRMWLVEAQGKTKGYDDGFDGEKIFTAASAQLYAIQDRNYQVTTAEDLDNTELGFVAGDGAKHYTLKFNLDEMSDDRYYLVDHLTHEQKPITNGMTYSFNAGANDPANRFAISRSTKSITDDVFEGKGIELRAKSGRIIEARNYTDETAEVEIFDVSGKVVDKFTVEPHDTDRIKLSLEGVFVVRAYNGQAKTTQKFIIK